MRVMLWPWGVKALPRDQARNLDKEEKRIRGMRAQALIEHNTRRYWNLYPESHMTVDRLRGGAVIGPKVKVDRY